MCMTSGVHALLPGIDHEDKTRPKVFRTNSVMLIVGCTPQDGRPTKSARRSDREDEDMTHAYL
jgi:hypothetical protein